MGHSVAVVAIQLAALLGFAAFDLRERAGLDRRPVRYPLWAALTLGAFAATVVVGRLAFYAVNWRLYAHDPAALLAVGRGGSVVIAGELGAVLFFFAFTRATRMPRWATLDTLARCLTLAWAAQLGVECVAGRLPAAAAVDALFYAGLFGLLVAFKPHVRIEGFAFLGFGVAGCTKRFVTDAVLPPASGGHIGPFSTQQVVALTLIGVAALLALARARCARGPACGLRAR